MSTGLKGKRGKMVFVSIKETNMKIWKKKSEHLGWK